MTSTLRETVVSERRGDFEVSTDPTRLNRPVIHRFLSEESYWARRIPSETVNRSIDHSLNFGLYEGASQIGFARVITDRATFAFIRDVFVFAEYRDRGLGTWLMEVVLRHPDLQHLRRVMLATRDAGALYQRLGFRPLARPQIFLAIETKNKELYQ